MDVDAVLCSHVYVCGGTSETYLCAPKSIVALGGKSKKPTTYTFAKSTSATHGSLGAAINSPRVSKFGCGKLLGMTVFFYIYIYIVSVYPRHAD